jgi:anti-anti-sigma factor
MELLEARRDGVLVLALKGRLDAASASSFQNLLAERMEQGERRFAVDASGLIYISSSGLRVLLQVARQLEKHSGRIVLCSVQESIRRIFEIAGFASLFRIYGSSEQAIQGCRTDD